MSDIFNAMKRFFFLLISIFILNACQSDKPKQAENQNEEVTTERPADWAGTFRGTIPCEDCEGIKLEVRLSANNTYQLFFQKFGLDEAVHSKGGTVRWKEGENVVVLEGINEHSGFQQLQIGPNFAKVLNAEGKEHQGENATAYILKKETFQIRDKKWELFYLESSIVQWKSPNPQGAYIIMPYGDNKLVGHAGCNRLMGVYEIESKSQINFTQLVTTKTMCPDIQYEYNFVDYLRKAKTYSLEDDVLTMYQSPGNPILKFRYSFF